MKKLFISSFLAITVAISGFAAERNKAGFALPEKFSFKFKQFLDVERTSSENSTNSTVATFIFYNIRTNALDTEAGEFVGIGQAMTLEDLPLNAKRAFAGKYQGNTVKEAIHFEGLQESTYFISAENEKGLVIPAVKDNGPILTIKK